MNRVQREHAQRIQALRTHLLELREKEIRPAFRESGTDVCLLRDALLDEFVGKRPRTKEDWLRMISYELRSGTDAVQVGRYLPRVLEIIAQTFE